MTSIDNRNPLIDRERIRGASRMIAEGRDAGSVTDDEIKQTAADVENFRRHNKIPRKTIAQAIGLSESVISEFLNGTYKGNNAQVAIDLDDWLVNEERVRSEPQLTQFVWTNVAMEIKATATWCLDESSIGLVYSPESSGFGKSTAFLAIHQLLGPRQSAMVTFDKVDSNQTGVLKKLCQALHIDDKGTNKQRTDRVIKRIATEDRRASNSTGRRFLLICDQIHNLRGAKDNTPFYTLPWRDYCLPYIDTPSDERTAVQAAFYSLAKVVSTPAAKVENLFDVPPLIKNQSAQHNYDIEYVRVLPVGATAAFEALFFAINAACRGSGRRGKAEGSSLILGLADGSMSVDEFNRRSMGKDV